MMSLRQYSYVRAEAGVAMATKVSALSAATEVAINSKRGGRIFIQIIHAGRMSHPDNTPHHRQAVAPSAIAADGQMFTATGMRNLHTRRRAELKRACC